MENKQTETKIAFYSSIAIIVLLIFLSLTSCKSKIQTIETHSTDTIYKSEIIKIDKPQLNEIFIDNVCDSLGNLLPIYYTNVSNNTQTSLKSSKNSLILSVNVDSIVNSKVNEYKSSIKIEKKKDIEFKTPNWIKKLLAISLFLNVVLLIWIFRKPLLRLVKPF